PGERRLLAGEPPVLVLLGSLVADVREIGADRAPAAVDHVAGPAALVLDELLAEVHEARALRLAVVAMADVAPHLHQRALVAGDGVGLAQRRAEQRLLPVLDRAVRGLGVHRPSLAAVAGGAAELLRRMVLERLRRVRPERLVGGLEALPSRGLVAGH